MRVGLLWRAEWDPPQPGVPIAESCRLRGVFAAFAALGVPAEPVVYSDESVDAVRDLLLDLDGVLVWVNPIEQELDRSKLDPLLREVADGGVWVSAHPDVILKMATKRVLVDTRELSWGTDTQLYETATSLRDLLLSRLDLHPRLVLKQARGMGGNGVWSVAPLTPSTDAAMLRVQHAVRESAPQELSLEEFVVRCEPYFAAGGFMVDQPFQPRLAEGMIRVYLTHNKVVGFARQYPRGLMRPDEASPAPATKVFELASASAYAELRGRMESEWGPQMQAILGVTTQRLPVIWDADFLYGSKTASGDDTFVLCEINASSTFAFPEHAMPTVAQAAISRIERSKNPR
jgi:hypothetical protein